MTDPIWYSAAAAGAAVHALVIGVSDYAHTPFGLKSLNAAALGAPRFARWIGEGSTYRPVGARLATVRLLLSPATERERDAIADLLRDVGGDARVSAGAGLRRTSRLLSPGGSTNCSTTAATSRSSTSPATAQRKAAEPPLFWRRTPVGRSNRSCTAMRWMYRGSSTDSRATTDLSRSGISLMRAALCSLSRAGSSARFVEDLKRDPAGRADSSPIRDVFRNESWRGRYEVARESGSRRRYCKTDCCNALARLPNTVASGRRVGRNGSVL